MRKNSLISLLIFISFLFIVSCQKDEAPIDYEKNDSGIKFTYEQILSIKDDIITPLSDEDVLNLVSEFNAKINETNFKSANTNVQLTIEDRYYASINSANNKNTRLMSNCPSMDSVQMYKISLSNGNEKGFSIVSADKRSPKVIAYIPNGDINDTVDNKGFACMLEYSHAILESDVMYYNKVVDSLKESTIEKICEIENITREQYYSGDYARKYSDSIYLEKDDDIQSKFVIINLWRIYNPLLTTQWDQYYPYNAQVNVSCLNGKAPAGCVAIATGQILNYYKKQPVNGQDSYNYDLFGNTTEVNPLNTQAVNEVSRLIINIGKNVMMDYKCSGSGASSSHAIASCIVGMFGLKSEHLKPMYNPAHFATAFQQKRVVYARGTDSEYGGHAWVIDGGFGFGGDPSIHPDPFGYSVHCNFGWKGANDGWFGIATRYTADKKWASEGSINTDRYIFQGLEGWVIYK